MTNSTHLPVLVAEVIEYLDVQPNQWYLDATLGGGGHAAAILAAGGRVIGIDQDRAAVDRARRWLESLAMPTGAWIVRQGRFAHIEMILLGLGIGPVMGVLFDLGLSSDQLADSERGFSFQLDAPLDMRMDRSLTVTAADLVNGLSQRELTQLFRRLGEVRYAKTVAEAIIERRRAQPIERTLDLAGLIEQLDRRLGGGRSRSKKTHPATQFFQALRMAVNDELGQLEQGLIQAERVLPEDGRLAVIAFHSLEDRVVKNFIRKSEQLKMLNKKVITPSLAETETNPRSRSAKLRAAVKQGRGLLVGGMAALIILAVLQVSFSARVAVTGRQIKSLEDEKASLQQEISQLKHNTSKLSSMARIEQKAVDDLGMVKVGQDIEYLAAPGAELLARN